MIRTSKIDSPTSPLIAALCSAFRKRVPLFVGTELDGIVVGASGSMRELRRHLPLHDSTPAFGIARHARRPAQLQALAQVSAVPSYTVAVGVVIAYSRSILQARVISCAIVPAANVLAIRTPLCGPRVIVN